MVRLGLYCAAGSFSSMLYSRSWLYPSTYPRHDHLLVLKSINFYSVWDVSTNVFEVVEYYLWGCRNELCGTLCSKLHLKHPSSQWVLISQKQVGSTSNKTPCFVKNIQSIFMCQSTTRLVPPSQTPMHHH
ncbi:uncharacterized protein LY89DRAFT_328662 [Mollisia scopiformis]|uniref:Uncharacterized protein n=1 Tax=Mollisia scopiformis TaxID=149040 RepID=A0A132B945_MOLSC|nr:uncharacterized protein LY89DRAFT_328662 [Mollisia scopiformis]KUJ08891.1 hypothetical protein LY89DRAFT_328662 [Mollisia scopiformis]